MTLKINKQNLQSNMKAIADYKSASLNQYWLNSINVSGSYFPDNNHYDFLLKQLKIKVVPFVEVTKEESE
jgi:hypothetical protein